MSRDREAAVLFSGPKNTPLSPAAAGGRTVRLLTSGSWLT